MSWRTMTTTRGRMHAGKKAHRSPETARTHMHRLIEGGAYPGTLNVYPCGDHWHVGHIFRRGRRS